MSFLMIIFCKTSIHFTLQLKYLYITLYWECIKNLMVVYKGKICYNDFIEDEIIELPDGVN